MKRLIYFLLLTCCSSCARYQYLTLSSETAVKAENFSFVEDRPAFTIQYVFNTDSSRLELTITNKSEDPLEVGWAASSIEIKSGGEGKGNISHAALRSGAEEAGRKSLSLAQPDGLPSQFIGPHATMQRNLVLPLGYLKGLSLREQEKQVIRSRETGDAVFRMKNFSREHAPLVISVRLLLVIGPGQGAEKWLTHDFYVSELWETHSGPRKFPPEALRRGDRFYMRK